MPVSESKARIVERAVVGLLVAFERSDGRMMTAEIVEKDPATRTFVVSTKYGTRYHVSYDDVQWVLDNDGNWPKYIYLRLKGKIDRDGNPVHRQLDEPLHNPYADGVAHEEEAE